MKPEEKAREKIDELLSLAGWFVQDMDELNLGATLGVAVREYPLSTGSADYLLFVERQPVGAIEAKPEGITLSGVSEQSQKYINSIIETFPQTEKPPAFVYESTGTETMFRDLRDPYPRSRHIFAFHKPETLNDWFSKNDTLRGRLRHIPELDITGLRDCQVEAIHNLEKSFYEARPRALVQMATGSGKTYMAVSSVYRLIKFANAKRVLFLVDRNNLGRQARTEFEQYVTPDDGRKFSELYNIQHLKSNTFDPVSRVCITTIQRLYSMLKGESDEEFDIEAEEKSLFDTAFEKDKPMEIVYNPKIPIETFDFIITDECHRSIYNLWRQVLEYLDAFIIGLTATPSKQTLGFFHQNLVSEYNHERAVADGVNVGYEVYRIKTKITDEGSKVEAGFYVDKRDKLTRQVRWEQLDTDLEYAAKELDRSVVSKNQIRTIVRQFKDALFTELFPGRTEVPKSLVFSKDDSHAEDIVEIIREEFGKGNEFCKKITYRTTGEKPEDLIASFRNSYHPRIAVTVDMVSTGTDIKPIECILFMRDVKSRVYFEQMKGRGTRTISETDLKSVTPDTSVKTHFVIVDAVGVCENDKTDSQPLERKRSVSFEKLMMSIASGSRNKDEISSLAGRLARLDKKLSIAEKKELQSSTDGKSLKEITNILLDTIDPDKLIEKAKEMFSTDKPQQKQIEQASKELTDEASKIFDSPGFRNTLMDVKKRSEQIIDTVSQDEIILSGFDSKAKKKAENVVTTFEKFIEENKNELDALQIIYSKPYGKRYLTFEQIKQLAEAIKKPPYNLTPEVLWKAYEQLEKAKVRGASPQKMLTNIISLVRFATELSDTLEPFPEVVERKFRQWLEEQKNAGVEFTSEQLEWLEMIKNHIGASVSIEVEDFYYAPFYEKGGVIKLHKLFGSKVEKILKQLNEVLVR
jgi:type I restriction enzyme R subunit